MSKAVFFYDFYDDHEPENCFDFDSCLKNQYFLLDM